MSFPSGDGIPSQEKADLTSKRTLSPVAVIVLAGIFRTPWSMLRMTAE